MKINVHAWGAGFEDLADQVVHMLHEIQGSNYFRSHAAPTWKPRVNVYETPTRYLLCVELAGVSADQIDVRTEGGSLHVRGARDKPEVPDVARPEFEAGDVSVHQMEIDSGRFHRTLKLAQDVNLDDIQALYRHGYLWIILPRRGGE
jgi:HSP20 family protein